MKTNFIIIIGILFLLEFYVYQAFKTVVERPIYRTLYWVLTIAIYAYLFYSIFYFNRGARNHHSINLMTGTFFIFLLPKLFIILFLLVDDLSRLLQYGFRAVSSSETQQFPGRRKFLSILGFGLFGLTSGLFLDGILFGKYRHKARQVKVKIPNLPASFRGYRIVQFSDAHLGTFWNPKKLEKAFQLINEQEPDLILFTGDMVNNYAEEMKPFIPYLNSLKAKDGKLSVLGNHDYGDYADWKSAAEKAQNIPNLTQYQKEAGFDLLRNEHRMIEKNGEKLYILGVENWGEKPFPQYGDLDKASLGIPNDAAKILMSHDPTHFDHIVKKHPSNIALTLSGHTHGMQFGLDLKNVKWSPVKYRYPKWADLYQSEGKLLYVNRGFGVLAYSGRVGVFPEITVFELS